MGLSVVGVGRVALVGLRGGLGCSCRPDVVDCCASLSFVVGMRLLRVGVLWFSRVS